MRVRLSPWALFRSPARYNWLSPALVDKNALVAAHGCGLHLGRSTRICLAARAVEWQGRARPTPTSGHLPRGGRSRSRRCQCRDSPLHPHAPARQTPSPPRREPPGSKPRLTGVPRVDGPAPSRGVAHAAHRRCLHVERKRRLGWRAQSTPPLCRAAGHRRPPPTRPGRRERFPERHIGRGCRDPRDRPLSRPDGRSVITDSSELPDRDTDREHVGGAVGAQAPPLANLLDAEPAREQARTPCSHLGIPWRRVARTTRKRRTVHKSCVRRDHGRPDQNARLTRSGSQFLGHGQGARSRRRSMTSSP